MIIQLLIWLFIIWLCVNYDSKIIFCNFIWGLIFTLVGLFSKTLDVLRWVHRGLVWKNNVIKVCKRLTVVLFILQDLSMLFSTKVLRMAYYGINLPTFGQWQCYFGVAVQLSTSGSSSFYKKELLRLYMDWEEIKLLKTLSESKPFLHSPVFISRKLFIL